jgi:hypothetical protein
MSEFFAWAATGLVVGLQSWSEAGRSGGRVHRNGRLAEGALASPLIDRQRFYLRQRDGREIEIFLADSGIAFRNGHAVTAVWAARHDALYGHCIYLENHTTGAIARLPENVTMIRPRASLWKVAGMGFLATVPAAATLLAWMTFQRGTSYLYQKSFLLSAGIATILLFIIGAVVAKLVSDYLRADDDQKIWLAADKALANARRVLLQKPVTKPYIDYGENY